MQAAGRPRLAVPVPEMLDQALRPPARLGCHITDAAAPPRRRDSAARSVIEQPLPLLEVEAPPPARQPRLAGPRGPAPLVAPPRGPVDSATFLAGTRKRSAGEKRSGT